MSSKSKSQSLVRTGLIRRTPILSIAAFAFLVLFVGVGVYLYQGSFADSTVDIIKSGDGGCLNDVNGSIAARNPINTATCTGSDAEQWYLSGSGTLENTALAGTHCIEPLNGATARGASVVMDTCNSSSSQHWERYDGGLLNVVSDKCLIDNGTINACGSSSTDWKWTTTSMTVASTCGSGVKASPATAQCIAKVQAAAKWSLSATTTISCGLSGQPCGKAVSNWGCLVALWNHESSWEWDADNTASGAYGIPQSLPGSKMASAGSDWKTNAATQIKWGLGYIKSTYGNPCGAWKHEEADNWYTVNQGV